MGLLFPSLQASLVAADRLWQSKREILDSVGFDTPQEFPVSADGMPQQLLSYLRLSRLQNAAEFAKVNCTMVRLPAQFTADCLYRRAAALGNTSFNAMCARLPSVGQLPGGHHY
jgi:Rubisco LSMT substrate-binding